MSQTFLIFLQIKYIIGTFCDFGNAIVVELVTLINMHGKCVFHAYNQDHAYFQHCGPLCSLSLHSFSSHILYMVCFTPNANRKYER